MIYFLVGASIGAAITLFFTLILYAISGKLGVSFILAGLLTTVAALVYSYYKNHEVKIDKHIEENPLTALLSIVAAFVSVISMIILVLRLAPH